MKPINITVYDVNGAKRQDVNLVTGADLRLFAGPDEFARIIRTGKRELHFAMLSPVMPFSNVDRAVFDWLAAKQ